MSNECSILGACRFTFAEGTRVETPRVVRLEPSIGHMVSPSLPIPVAEPLLAFGVRTSWLVAVRKVVEAQASWQGPESRAAPRQRPRGRRLSGWRNLRRCRL